MLKVDEESHSYTKVTAKVVEIDTKDGVFALLQVRRCVIYEYEFNGKKYVDKSEVSTLIPRPHKVGSTCKVYVNKYGSVVNYPVYGIYFVFYIILTLFCSTVIGLIRVLYEQSRQVGGVQEVLSFEKEVK